MGDEDNGPSWDYWTFMVTLFTCLWDVIMKR